MGRKILIPGCQNAKNELWIACMRYLGGMNKKDVIFKIYQNSKTQELGILNCSYPRKISTITRLVHLNLRNSLNCKKNMKFQIATSILHYYPNKDLIINNIQVKVSIEAIKVKHPNLSEYNFYIICLQM